MPPQTDLKYMGKDGDVMLRIMELEKEIHLMHKGNECEGQESPYNTIAIIYVSNDSVIYSFLPVLILARTAIVCLPFTGWGECMSYLLGM